MADKSCRVLVVEDEYLLAFDFADVLTRLGVEVVGPVSTCQDALAAIDSSSIDFAVIDVRLATGDGYPVADELARRSIPFFFSTGYAPADRPDRFKNVQVWRKPYESADLVEAIWGLCPHLKPPFRNAETVPDAITLARSGAITGILYVATLIASRWRRW